jgi:hypothetical protein
MRPVTVFLDAVATVARDGLHFAGSIVHVSITWLSGGLRLRVPAEHGDAGTGASAYQAPARHEPNARALPAARGTSVFLLRFPLVVEGNGAYSADW